jgi:hypothetical protein
VTGHDRLHAATIPLSDGPPSRARRARDRAGQVASRVAGPARLLPGLAAAGAAFAGSWLLWGLGWALLVAAGLLLAVDARTDRA